MKIYYDGIIYSWHKHGGIRRYFDELIMHLPVSTEPLLLVREPHYHLPNSKNLKIEELRLTKIPWPEIYHPYLKRIFAPIYTLKINSYFKSIHEGIFHSTYFTTYTNLQIPQVVTVHDMSYERFPEFFQSPGSKRFIRQKKRCIERADTVICVSHATKKYLKETYTIPEEKLTVIHHGINALFNMDPEQKVCENLVKTYNLTRPFFLFVGYRGLYKNFNFFIRSFTQFKKNKDFDIVIIGGEKLLKKENSYFTSLGITKQIKHIQNASEIELKNIYHLCIAFIYPSLDEGFGLPILEGLRCGAQVLASDIPVFREIADDAPIYFDPKDEHSLIAALEKSVEGKRDQNKIKEISEHIGNAYTWEICAEKTRHVYEKILRKPK